MRIGLLGPCDDERVLRESTERLIGEAGADQVIYLGVDQVLDQVVQQWSREIMGSDGSFLDRAAIVATRGTPAEIETLLQANAQLRRLSNLRKLPAPPARAVEMLDDYIVLAVYDKAVLDEEDIANATVIVYGKSDKPLFKRFGPRCFFTPGPSTDGRVGILELDSTGQLVISLCDPGGAPQWRETLKGRGAKLTVSS